MQRSRLSHVFISVLLLLYLSSGNAQSDTFSFAVKGGVSLGSYEAGLNYVYLEQIRRQNKKLNTFTGASAGSINALLSAIRYCEVDTTSSVDNNLFRTAWDLGLDKLTTGSGDAEEPEFIDFSNHIKANILANRKLPVQGSDRGGLFNRSGLLDSLREIYRKIQHGQFKPGCEVKVGIAVTKFSPDTYKINGIDIKNQRYIVPFIVKVSPAGKLYFTNTYLFDRKPAHTGRLNQIDRYIFLPYQKKSTDDPKSAHRISVFDIFRTILASSAFPLAFPPVMLNYCISEITGDITSDICPSGYREHTELFIDGGSLDNAPIGAAQRLTLKFPCSRPEIENCIIGPEQSFNLIYINPGSIRERTGKQQADRNKAAVTSPSTATSLSKRVIGLSDYLSIGGHILEYGMSAELYRTLTDQRQGKQGKLLSSSRFYPLTGDYLEHFGAFFDPAFRMFDYYAGLYDGVVNVATFNCIEESADCIPRQIKLLIKDLEIDRSESMPLFILLASREFYRYREDQNWKWLFSKYNSLTPKLINIRRLNSNQGKLIDLFLALDERNCIHPIQCNANIVIPSFNHFLSSLTNIARYDRITQRMVASEERWNEAVFESVINRTIKVEKDKYRQLSDIARYSKGTADSNNAHTQKLVVSSLETVALFGKSVMRKRSTGRWPVSTYDHCDGRACWLMYAVPDEMGMHADNVGGYISYRVPAIKFTRSLSSIIAIDPLHAALSTDDYSSAEFLLHLNMPGIFLSSFSAGVKGYRTIGSKERYPDALYYGYIFRTGLFADKVQISLGYRMFSEPDWRKQLELTFGLSDVKSLVSLIM